jgi:tetratricopeptide (TPR) repeat protein
MKIVAFILASQIFVSPPSFAQDAHAKGGGEAANSNTEEASAEPKNSPQDLSKQADRLLEKGDWKAAYAVIEKAHAAMDRVDLTKIPAWYQQLAFKRGWCALKLEKWKEAGEWFETSYRKFADPRDNPYCKLALRGWADAAAGAGDLELSVRLYKKYLTESSKVDWDNPFSRTR